MEIDWTNLVNAAIQCVVFSGVGLVMFAVAFDINVADHDHVIIAFHLFKGAREHFFRVFIIASKKFFVGFDHTPRRIEQAFAGRIVTCPENKRANSLFGLFAAGPDDRLFYGL